MDLLSAALIVLGMAFIAVLLVFFISGMLFGAGYQPAPRSAVGAALDSVDLKGKVFYDLGAGFGRTLFEASRHGPNACVGVEIDPLKCWWINRRSRALGLDATVKAIRRDIMETDLSAADVLFVFLTPGFMGRLKPKILAEMKLGSVVISYDHRFDGWEPSLFVPEHKIRVYTVR